VPVMGYPGDLVVASWGKAEGRTSVGGGPGATLHGVLLRQEDSHCKRLATE